MNATREQIRLSFNGREMRFAPHLTLAELIKVLALFGQENPRLTTLAIQPVHYGPLG